MGLKGGEVGLEKHTKPKRKKKENRGIDYVRKHFLNHKQNYFKVYDFYFYL